MKSSVIKINDEMSNMAEILTIAQNSSDYAGLDTKKSLRLRLLAEELVGLLKELSGNYDGEFWIEEENQKFELVTHIYVNEEMDNKTKRSFIDVSSSKKNAAAKGIMGKIRDVVENMMYAENAEFSFVNDLSKFEADIMLDGKTINNEQVKGDFNVDNIVDGLMIDNSWSLNQYKKKQKDREEPWDEIEKSIIANLADDVTVSVKGRNIEIIITKNFK